MALNLSINDFKNVLSTCGVGGQDAFVAIEGEKLSVKIRQELPTAEMKQQNQVIREQLLNALTKDTQCGNANRKVAAYAKVLTSELLGKEKGKALDMVQLKSILDRHITIMTLSTANDKAVGATDTFVKAAAQQAVDVKNLKVGKHFFTALQRALAPADNAEAVVKYFQDTLTTASKSLQAAYKLKGAEIGTKKGLAALKAAEDSLGALADIARQVNNKLVRLDKDVPPELEALLDFASSRQPELCVIRGAVEGITAFEKDVGTAPNVQQMMATLAGKMHTAADAAEQMEGKLAALNQRLESYTGQEQQATSETEINALKGDLAALGTFVNEVQSSGVMKMDNGVELHMEQSFVTGLNQHLKKLDKALAQATQFSYKKGMQAMVDDAFMLGQDIKMNYILGNVRTQFTQQIEKGWAFDDAFALSMKTSIESALHKAFGSVKNAKLVTKFPRSLSEVPMRLFVQKLRVLQCRQEAAGKGVLAATNADIKKMLAGNVTMETVLGARMYGFEDDLIDSNLDDTALQHEKRLGEGANNVVTRVTHEVRNEQGEEVGSVTHVFKPETSALLGMGSLVGGGLTAYQGVNSVAQINHSSYQAAKMLGIEHVMTKISVGMHNNQFGFFMEEAHGLTPAEYADGVHDNGKFLKPEEEFPAKRLRGADKLRLTGSLMKGSNELMWTDWLTGQFDRHRKNYLVSVGRDGTATIKGVDNDGAFSAERFGLRTFRLADNRLTSLLTLAGVSTPEEFQIMFPGALTQEPNGPHAPNWVINAGNNKVLVSLVGRVFGINSFARPSVIGQGMYDKLMALGNLSQAELRDEVVKMMGKGWYTPTQVDATLARLTEMITHVRTFKKNQIIADNAWNNKATQQTIQRQMMANDIWHTKKTDLPTNATTTLINFLPNAERFVVATVDYYLRDFASLMGPAS